MDLLWALVIIVLILWVLGFGFSIGGSLIHSLLVVAIVIIIYRLVTGRRTPL